MRIYPMLERVPDGSHVWFCTARKSLMAPLVDQELVAAWVRESPMLMSPHASRIVTCHADFHPGNVIRSSDGIVRCIDFEFTCVTFAVLDLAYASRMWLKGAAQKREFFGADFSVKE